MTRRVLILLLKPFRVGDNIIAQGQEGTVTDIEIFYTKVTTYDNRTVVVPNGKLSNEVIDESAEILKTPERRIGVSTIEESGYKVMISIWLNAHGFNDARLKFQEVLVKKLKEGGLPLPGIQAK